MSKRQNISYAHIENFKNLNQIAQAKGEIIKNIIPGGAMVINRDDKYLANLTCSLPF